MESAGLVVYVSASSDDEGREARSRLEKAADSAGVTVLGDGDVPAGSDWRSSFDALRDQAEAAVVVVSPGALRSESMFAEVDALLRRRSEHPSFRVVPLTTDNVSIGDVVQSPLRLLTDLQFANAPTLAGRVAQALAAVAPDEVSGGEEIGVADGDVGRGVDQAVVSNRDAPISLQELGGQLRAVLEEPGGGLALWDVRAGSRVSTLDGSLGVESIAISTVGARTLIAAGSANGRVRLWDGETGAEVGGVSHEGRVVGVDLVQVGFGLRVVSVSSAGSLQVWDGESPQPMAVFEADDPYLSVSAFESEDHLFAFSGVLRDHVELAVVESIARDETERLDLGPRFRVQAESTPRVVAAGLAGEAMFAAGGEWGAIRLWDAEGRELARLEAHEGEVTALEAVVLNRGGLIVSGGADGSVYAIDTESLELSRLGSHEDSVAAVTGFQARDRRLVISVDMDGQVVLWDVDSDEGMELARLEGVPRCLLFVPRRAQRDQVEWITDAPAVEDTLGRRPLARALAERFRRIRNEDPRTSFLIHIDGRWGSGKSTLLEFLGDELGGRRAKPGDKRAQPRSSDWLVVRFDAWRQSRVGPPWWSLLTSLRYTITIDLDWLGRLRLRVAETWARVHRAGAPFLLGLALLLAVAAGLFYLLRPTELTGVTAGELARTVTAIVAAVGTLWAGAFVVSRFLLWESAAGARLFEQSNENPMESLADHFAWLLKRAGRPSGFFIDDLDRCEQSYVVDLLDSVQTLIRDVPKRVNRDDKDTPAPYFVVAADGAWIRRSYEQAYRAFEEAVEEPGRPLGYLFLDKIFQLTVPVPSISTAQRAAYLRMLLRSGAASGKQIDQEKNEVERRVRASTTRNEAVSVLSEASAPVRAALAPVVIEKLNEAGVAQATESALEKFAPLLEPNPRAMKRFVNSFAIADSVLVLEDQYMDRDPLALWMIVRSRWPGLADYLWAHPEATDMLGRSPADGVPAHLAPLFGPGEVARVISFANGGPLTSAHVRMIASLDNQPAGER
jgi:hypothetical protein